MARRRSTSPRSICRARIGAIAGLLGWGFGGGHLSCLREVERLLGHLEVSIERRDLLSEREELRDHEERLVERRAAQPPPGCE